MHEGTIVSTACLSAQPYMTKGSSCTCPIAHSVLLSGMSVQAIVGRIKKGSRKRQRSPRALSKEFSPNDDSLADPRLYCCTSSLLDQVFEYLALVAREVSAAVAPLRKADAEKVRRAASHALIDSMNT